MAGFIYFKPGTTQANVTFEDLKEWGLEYAFEDKPATREIVHPEHGRGILFGVMKEFTDRSMGFYPDDQEWGKVPGTDCYVGCYRDAKPTVDELCRRDHVPGYTFVLEDGKQWSIPRVIAIDEGEWESSLPCRLDVDDDGKLIKGAPIAKYQYLWDLAKPYIDTFLVPSLDNETQIDRDGVLGDAVKFLAVNYRVGIREVILLELFTEEIEDKPLAVCLLAIDYPTWTDWEKSLKKSNDQQDIDGSATSNGSAEEPLATSQRRLT